MTYKELTVKEFIELQKFEINSTNFKFIEFDDLSEAINKPEIFNFLEEEKYQKYLNFRVADVVTCRNEEKVTFKCFYSDESPFRSCIRKYILTNDTIKYNGETLYRIRSVNNFRRPDVQMIKVGDFGGYVLDLNSLSQEGDCWIFNDAKVIDGNVSENAIVGGNAIIERGLIYGDAQVYGSAYVCGNSVRICDRSSVYGTVTGAAKVCGTSDVYAGSEVVDNERVCDAKSYVPLFNNVKESLRCQLGIIPIDNKIIAYKLVNNDLTSIHDHNFKYVVGEYAVVENPNMSNKVCSSGLHFSTATYYDLKVTYNTRTILVAEIELDDIITVQNGKIRCKRAKILDSYVIPMSNDEEV